MNPRKLLRGLTYLKEVEAKKQTYYVYEGDDHYVLLTRSRSKGSYSLNVIPSSTVVHVKNAFNGRRKLTTAQVMAESKRSTRLSDRFDALSALYVLCAMDEAKIDKRYHDRQLYFNLRKD